MSPVAVALLPNEAPDHAQEEGALTDASPLSSGYLSN